MPPRSPQDSTFNDTPICITTLTFSPTQSFLTITVAVVMILFCVLFYLAVLCYLYRSRFQRPISLHQHRPPRHHSQIPPQNHTPNPVPQNSPASASFPRAGRQEVLSSQTLRRSNSHSPDHESSGAELLTSSTPGTMHHYTMPSSPAVAVLTPSIVHSDFYINTRRFDSVEVKSPLDNSAAQIDITARPLEDNQPSIIERQEIVHEMSQQRRNREVSHPIAKPTLHHSRRNISLAKEVPLPYSSPPPPGPPPSSSPPSFPKPSPKRKFQEQMRREREGESQKENYWLPHPLHPSIPKSTSEERVEDDSPTVKRPGWEVRERHEIPRLRAQVSERVKRPYSKSEMPRREQPIGEQEGVAEDSDQQERAEKHGLSQKQNHSLPFLPNAELHKKIGDAMTMLAPDTPLPLTKSTRPFEKFMVYGSDEWKEQEAARLKVKTAQQQEQKQKIIKALKPEQQRAMAWMIEKEKGVSVNRTGQERNESPNRSPRSKSPQISVMD